MLPTLLYLNMGYENRQKAACGGFGVYKRWYDNSTSVSHYMQQNVK